jgi:hypothetical protein
VAIDHAAMISGHVLQVGASRSGIGISSPARLG